MGDYFVSSATIENKKTFGSYTNAITERVGDYFLKHQQLSQFASLRDFKSLLLQLYGAGKTLHGKRFEFAWQQFQGNRFRLSKDNSAPFDVTDRTNTFAQQLKTQTNRGQIGNSETLNSLSGGSIHERLKEDVALTNFKNFQLVTHELNRTGTGEVDVQFTGTHIRSIPKGIFLENSVTYNSIINQIFTPKSDTIRIAEVEKIWREKFGNVISKTQAEMELNSWRFKNEESKSFEYSEIFSQDVLNAIMRYISNGRIPIMNFGKTRTTYSRRGFDMLIAETNKNKEFTGYTKTGNTSVLFPSPFDSESKYYIAAGIIPDTWLEDSGLRRKISSLSEKIPQHNRTIFYNAYYIQNPDIRPKDTKNRYYVKSVAEKRAFESDNKKSFTRS